MELEPALQQARETWEAGNYDTLARYIWSVGGDLVERLDIAAGESVLDVACGTGNAAIPAAQRGARVVGLDLTPKMFDAGRRRAAEAGVEIEWREGDAQALPYDDGSFDVVLSTFGCMFAPDHARAAREIVRVLRPGGRFGVAAWTPDGNIGSFFASIGDFLPPPPPGAVPPVLWGTREHATDLFTRAGADVTFHDAAVDFRFDSLDAAVDEYSTNFGPIVMLRRALEPQGRWPEALAAIRATFAARNGGADGRLSYPGEYLITRGRKSAAG